MSNIQEKLDETVDYYNKVNAEIIEAENRVEQLKEQRQQLIGRAQTYHELLAEEESDDSDEDDEAETPNPPPSTPRG